MGLFGLGAIVGAFIGGRITDHFGFYPQQVAALFLGRHYVYHYRLPAYVCKLVYRHLYIKRLQRIVPPGPMPRQWLFIVMPINVTRVFFAQPVSYQSAGQ
jgi:MFS family permease